MPGVDALLVLGLAAVILIHSLLEFPLWYVSFLAVFAVLIGLSPAKAIAINLRMRTRLRYAISMGFVVIVCWQTVACLVMYQDWREWVKPSDSADENMHRSERVIKAGG